MTNIVATNSNVENPLAVIMIGPYQVPVYEEDKLLDTNGARRLHGKVDFHPDFYITLDRETVGPLRDVTLIHEIVHAILWAYDINLGESEEHYTRLISTGLADVLLNNGMWRSPIEGNEDNHA